MESTLPVEPNESVTVPVEPTPAIKAGWLRAVLSLPLWIAAQALMSIVALGLIGFGKADNTAYLVGSPMGIVVQLLQMAGTLLVVLPFCRFIDRRSIISLGLALDSKIVRDLIAGVLCGIALISSIFVIIYFLGGITVTGMEFPGASLVFMFFMLVIVAVNEELFIRGYLLSNFMASTNKYVALAISSLIFSLGHFFNPNSSLIGLLNIILAGLVLGIYYVHRRNLWFPIGIHFAWNFFQGPFYGSEVSGVKVPSVLQTTSTGSELLTGGSFGFEASVVTSVVLALSVLAIHWLYRPSLTQGERGLLRLP